MWKELKTEWNDYTMCCYMNEEKSSVLEFIYYKIKHWYLRGICKLRGHKWINESHIGPDNGYECHHCERCGESWDHIWY